MKVIKQKITGKVKHTIESKSTTYKAIKKLKRQKQ